MDLQPWGRQRQPGGARSTQAHLGAPGAPRPPRSPWFILVDLAAPGSSWLLPAAAGLLGIVRAERPRHVLSVGYPVPYS